ncbi:MAG: YceD family protein [Bacteroidales bacterium]
MSKQGKYAVRISGLGEGVHHFSFDLDDQFFASFENPELKSGRIEAGVILEKTASYMALHFDFDGEVELECDRCLDAYMAAFYQHQTVFVKYGDHPGELEDDVIMIQREDYEIEVGQLMYEYIVLSLPVQRIHPDDGNGNSGCDPEMIEKLNALAAKEPNMENQGDPRWDALKGIIEKNN